MYIYIYIYIYIMPTSEGSGRRIPDMPGPETFAAARMGPSALHSAKGGAAETGCSDLYDIAY